jgi:hypothetical protein
MQAETSSQSPSTERNRPVRRHPRIFFTVPLTLHHLVSGGVQSAHGITLDISEAGLGALVQGDLRLGETVEVDLPLPGRILNAVAIVRHTSSMRSGFEFLGLTPEERLLITSAAGNA